MKGVLGGNHQGFSLNSNQSLKIEAELAPSDFRLWRLAAISGVTKK